MNILRVIVSVLWIVLMIVSVNAVQKLGIDGSNVFITDFAHPWRAQFNTDFAAHLVLIAMWTIYREQKLWIGIPCAILCILCGGAFSLVYILVSTFRTGGDVRKLLLGKNV